MHVIRHIAGMGYYAQMRVVGKYSDLRLFRGICCFWALTGKGPRVSSASPRWVALFKEGRTLLTPPSQDISISHLDITYLSIYTIYMAFSPIYHKNSVLRCNCWGFPMLQNDLYSMAKMISCSCGRRIQGYCRDGNAFPLLEYWNRLIVWKAK